MVFGWLCLAAILVVLSWVLFRQVQLILLGVVYTVAGLVRSVGGARGRVVLHPDAAAARGITDGDVVRVFNDRGQVLAGAVVRDSIRPDVVRMSTGSWYDPAEPGGLDVHGNPNVLTRDVGTSRLAQGPSAHSALVEVEKWHGDVPDVTVFGPLPQ